MESERAGFFAGELEAPRLLELRFLAGGQFDEYRLGLDRLTVFLQLLRLFRAGPTLKGRPARIAANGERAGGGHRRTGGRCTRIRRRRRGSRVADGEVQFLAALEIANHDFGVALRRTHPVGKPLPVVRDNGILQAFPGEDVRQLNGLLCPSQARGNQ
jgi:hypothetical protein